MNEHDDDLESEVIEDGQQEEDRFPNTDDELDDDLPKQRQDEQQDGDGDPSEL